MSAELNSRRRRVVMHAGIVNAHVFSAQCVLSFCAQNGLIEVPLILLP